MYRIYYGEEVVYDPFSPDEHAFNVTCYGGINDKGNMNFSIPFNHPLYSKFRIRDLEVRLTSDDENIFVGYITQIEKDFNLTLSIKCAGILGYLGDVLIPPYTTNSLEQEEGMVLASSGGPAELFNWYIDTYNEKASHKFVVDVNDTVQLGRLGIVHRSNTQYSSVGQEIENQLLDTLGGYIFATQEKMINYLNYYYDVTEANPQIIDFGVNILDYTYTEDCENLYSAVLVTGGTISETVTDEAGNESEVETDVEISNVYDTLYGDIITKGNVIINKEAYERYGYRETYYSNTDAQTGQELYELASGYLKIVSNPDIMLVVKAVDLSLFMENYTHLKPGQIVRVRSKPHGLDEYLVVTQIDIDLDDPSNSEFTLGVVYDTLTGEQSGKLRELNSNLNTAVDEVASLGQDVLDQAEEAAKTRDELMGIKERFESSEFDRSRFEKEIRDSILDLQKIADGAIETWFFPYGPSLENEPAVNWKTDEDKYNHIGDLFYNTVTGKAYRWMYAPNAQGALVYSWGPIVDTDIEEALKQASIAKDTADSKRRVFIDIPYPPYEEGDLWAQGGHGDILVSTRDRSASEKFNEKDWVYAAKYADAVYETEEEFYQSLSPLDLVGGRWESTNTWVDGYYTWRRTKVTYGDGSWKWDPSEKGVCITGNTGDPGVGIESVDVEYYLSRYSDRLAGDVWHTDPPDFIQGRFMWSRTKVVYTDGSYAYTPSEDGVCIAVSGTEGSDGVSISYIEEQYIRIKSNTVAPDIKDPGWSSKYPGWVEGEFLWTRSVIHYNDGSTSMTDAICVSGIKGDKGTGVSNVDVWYYLSRSSTELIGGSWVSIPPQWVEGRFMWTKTIVTYTDGIQEETKPVCIALSGKDGNNGLGVSFLEEQYYQSASNTTPPGRDDKAWTNVYPGMNLNKPYIWTRTKITYSDGSFSYTDPICVTGPKGDKGDEGLGIQNVNVWYYLSRSSTEYYGGSWQDTPPQWVEGRFMWTKTVVTYTDGTKKETEPVCIALSGKNGTNGLGVSFMEEQYYQSSSNTTVPPENDSAGWVSKYPGITTTKPYIWTRTKITYTDGSFSFTTPICVTGPKGDTGNGVSSITQYYLVSPKSTGVKNTDSGWATDPPTMTPTNKYLWNFTRTDYTNGTFKNTEAKVIGVYGDKGDKGDKGDPGKDGTNGTNGTNGRDGEIPSGSCGDLGDNATKTVSNLTPVVTLKDGLCIVIFFTKGNTASNPKLKVTSIDSTVRNIMTNGVNEAYWQDSQTVTFVYHKDENAWYVASHPVWATKATIGNPAQTNILIDGTSLKFRNGSTVKASYTDTKITLGQETSDKNNVLIDADSGISFRTGTTVNSSFTSSQIELGKNSSSSQIKMCGEKGKILYGNLDGKNTNYLNFASTSNNIPVLLRCGESNTNCGEIYLTNTGWGSNVFNSSGISNVGMGASSSSCFMNAANVGIDVTGNANTANASVQIYAYNASFTMANGRTTFYGETVFPLPYKTNTTYSMYGRRLLYSGTGTLDGTSGNLTLSETAANFDIFDIYFRTNNTDYSFVRVYSPNGKRVSLTATRKGGTSIWVKTKTISISGTTVSLYTTTSGSTVEKFFGEVQLTGGSYPDISYGGSNIVITQIVGWK